VVEADWESWTVTWRTTVLVSLFEERLVERSTPPPTPRQATARREAMREGLGRRGIWSDMLLLGRGLTFPIRSVPHKTCLKHV